MIEKLSNSGERLFATRVIVAARAGDVRALRASAEPDLTDQLTPEVVRKLQTGIPPVGRIVLATVFVETTANGTFKTFNHEVGAGNRWAMVQVVMRTDTAAPQLIGLHTYPTPVQPIKVNDFGQRPLTIGGALWLIAMIAAFATSLAGVVIAWRRKTMRRRWLWVIGSALPVVTLTMNWTTGAWQVTPVSVLVLGAAGMRSGPFMPWLFSFAIPVVALIVIVRAWRDRRAQAEAVEA